MLHTPNQTRYISQMKHDSHTAPNALLTRLATILGLFCLLAFGFLIIETATMGDPDPSSETLPTLTNTAHTARLSSKWQPVTLEANDSIFTIATYFGISHQTIQHLFIDSATKQTLTELPSGSIIYLLFNNAHQLIGLKCPFNEQRTLTLIRSRQHWSAQVSHPPIYQQVITATQETYHYPSRISHSIYQRWKQTSTTLIDLGLRYPFSTDLIPTHFTYQIYRQSIMYAASHPTLKIASLRWHSVVIEPGDNWMSLANRLGVSYQDFQQILTIPTAKITLSHLEPGKIMGFQLSDTHQLTAIHYAYSEQDTLWLKRYPNGWKSHIVHEPIIRKLVYASSDQSNLNKETESKLKRIFKGAVRLKPSDHFNVLYEQYYLKNKPHHTGYIMLAAVTHNHKTYQAVRYTDSAGHTDYYKPTGQPLHTSLFLSAPLKYKRISDPFNLHRMHPILHKARPHYGIDYAAPKGTPVRAVAGGKIKFSGKDGGYGNAVIIHHNGKFETIYAHLSHISHRVHSGVTVQKGEIIGYVGSTGLATGPHLHFGLYAYGKAVNPAYFLPKKAPQAAIAKRDLPDFLEKTNRLFTHT